MNNLYFFRDKKRKCVFLQKIVWQNLTFCDLSLDRITALSRKIAQSMQERSKKTDLATGFCFFRLDRFRPNPPENWDKIRKKFEMKRRK